MTFDFYTEDSSKYTVGDNKVLKNSEILAAGNIFIFQLLPGYPAFLIISRDDFLHPTIIKTPPVTSILPDYEYFDGKQCPEKIFYELKFFLNKYSKRVFTFSCMGIDQVHAEHLVRLRYGSQISIFRVKEINQTNNMSKGKFICC
ncbi:hypothetical protein CJ195_15760 [Bacillus sp. UMB0899]|nr:hypothetical protein CJ195_15760 [Bacillus sp. UMB0899]